MFCNLFGAARVASMRAQWKDPGYLDTLAAAYAEFGDFPQAIDLEKKVLKSPEFVNKSAEAARKRLELYRKHQPYREPLTLAEVVRHLQ